MSENMNEKYQQHYNQIISGTLTDTIMKSISYQANIKLANDIIAGQEKTISELQSNNDISKKELEDTVNGLKKELESERNNKIISDKNYQNSISKLNTDISTLNAVRGENEQLKRQVQQINTLNVELNKSKEDYKNLRLIHQGEIDKLTNNYEKLVTELTSKIESLESPSPTKTNKKAPAKVAKKTVSKNETEELLLKDGGSF